jgi:hypothetical protein
MIRFLLLKEKTMRRLVCLMFVLVVNATASGYSMQGLDVAVDYWAGSGSNETIVVIDWNKVNGPYTTESHAWGFRWDGAAYVSDALAAIDTAGALNITTQYDGNFFWDAFYNNPLIDGDNHTSVGDYSGWWWAGDTTDGGTTWTGNDAGITTEILGNGKIEGLNLDNDNWTSATLTIPTPEPCTIMILGLGGLLIKRKKHYGDGR